MREYNAPATFRDAVLAMRDAMVADGWSIEPTYQNETIESAFRLKRDGYIVSAVARETQNAFYISVAAWGDDGLAIDIDPRDQSTFQWENIVAAKSKCGECGKTGVETRRVAFANRVCNECLPSARARYETPGWCN